MRWCVACGLLLLWASDSTAETGDVRTERRIAASDASLRQRWQRVTPTTAHRVVKLEGKGANAHELITPSGRFVLRNPGNAKPSLRRSGGLRRLAAIFGEPELVPVAIEGTTPFAVGDIPAGTPIEVMERLPLSFRDGSDPAAQSWFDAVSEERRVLGATMDLLSEFADRTPRNLMLNAGGTLRLIDVDSAFGAWRRRSLVHASAFFPGLRLGYRLPQERFDSLPPPVRAGVARLADSVDVDLARTLRVEPQEALLPIHYARRVQRVGLTAAIAEYLGSVRLAAPK
jgi:hypothetical protein